MNYICEFNGVDKLSQEEEEAIRKNSTNKTYNICSIKILFKQANIRSTLVITCLYTISMFTDFSLLYIIPNLIDYSSDEEEYNYMLIF